MSWFEKFDRFALFLALIWAAYFLVQGQMETALALIFLWVLVRASICCLDVFHTFFTEKPLIRSTNRTPNRRRISVSSSKEIASFRNILDDVLVTEHN